MMTTARFIELKNGAIPTSEAEKTLDWEARSKRAKQAVKTKRAKYKKWPTRKNDHK